MSLDSSSQDACDVSADGTDTTDGTDMSDGTGGGTPILQIGEIDCDQVGADTREFV